MDIEDVDKNVREEMEKKIQEERKKRKAEIIKKILEDESVELDCDRVTVSAEYYYKDSKTGSMESLMINDDSIKKSMTKRQAKIIDETKGIYGFFAEDIQKYCEKHNMSSSSLNWLLRFDDSMHTDIFEEERGESIARSEKIRIIKEMEDGNRKCVVELEDAEFGKIQVETTLKYALLASMDVKTLEIISIENEQETSKKSPITLKSIKEGLKRFFGRGER